MDVQWIEVSRLATDGVQTRTGLRESAVADYAEAIASGVEMPPALVFDDGETLWLAAGHHRRAGYIRAGKTHMPCMVTKGNRWEAIQAGMLDNQKHKGERLTRADKRRNVLLVLRERPSLSDSEIGRLCDVDHKTVAARRTELESTWEIPKSTERVGRDGRTIDTAGIGQQSPSVAADTPAADETTQTADELAMPAEGRTGPLGKASAGSTPDIDHCQCGGQWESSGEGWRFCASCGRVHPDDPKPEVDDDPQEASVVQPTESAKREADQQTAAVLFSEAVRQLGRTKGAIEPLANACPGVHYRRVLDLLDNVGDVLRVWRREAEEEGLVLTA